MYLSIGDHVIIDKNSLIGIFDIGIYSKSIVNRRFLKYAEQENNVVHLDSDEHIKTIIVTTEKIYLSSTTHNTLFKRFVNSYI